MALASADITFPNPVHLLGGRARGFVGGHGQSRRNPTGVVALQRLQRRCRQFFRRSGIRAPVSITFEARPTATAGRRRFGRGADCSSKLSLDVAVNRCHDDLARSAVFEAVDLASFKKRIASRVPASQHPPRRTRPDQQRLGPILDCTARHTRVVCWRHVRSVSRPTFAHSVAYRCGSDWRCAVGPNSTPRLRSFPPGMFAGVQLVNSAYGDLCLALPQSIGHSSVLIVGQVAPKNHRRKRVDLAYMRLSRD
jgi:hypothetical protein